MNLEEYYFKTDTEWRECLHESHSTPSLALHGCIDQGDLTPHRGTPSISDPQQLLSDHLPHRGSHLAYVNYGRGACVS